MFTPPTNEERTVYTIALVWGLTRPPPCPCKSLINKGIAAVVFVSKPICRLKNRSSHQRNSRSCGAIAVHLFSLYLLCSVQDGSAANLAEGTKVITANRNATCTRNDGRNSLQVSRRRHSNNCVGALQETSGFFVVFQVILGLCPTTLTHWFWAARGAQRRAASPPAYGW